MCHDYGFYAHFGPSLIGNHLLSARSGEAALTGLRKSGLFLSPALSFAYLCYRNIAFPRQPSVHPEEKAAGPPQTQTKR